MMPEGREDSDLEGDLFDGHQAKNYLGYVSGSVRRRKRLAAVVFAVILLGTVLALATFPKTYRVEAKLLAQRNPSLSVRGDNGNDAPTRAAAETVLRHDNLVGLIKQTDLVRQYAEHRAPAVRARDAIFGLLQRDATEQDRVDAMVELLEKHFNVWSEEGGTVVIAIEWPDPMMAFHLVDDAQQSFLEARHIQEISSIADAVGILQGHAASLRADVDSAVDDIKKLREARHPTIPAPAAVPAPSPPPRGLVSSPPPAAPNPAATTDPELAKLRVLIDAKQRAITDLEDFRRHRLSELQAHLAEQQAVYTENHPVIVDLQQTIASLSTESPQVTALRKQVSDLQAEFDRRTGELGASPARPAARSLPVGNVRAPLPQLPTEILALDDGPREERDPAMVYARGQLRDAMDKYAALRAQIQAAQIDLETAEAAFKYRYTVVTPAQIPKRATKPNVIIFLLAGLLAGLLVGIVAAVIADVRAGRIVERWQVEDVLDKPILGEVDIRALPPRQE
jgi:hypothetical protein